VHIKYNIINYRCQGKCAAGGKRFLADKPDFFAVHTKCQFVDPAASKLKVFEECVLGKRVEKSIQTVFFETKQARH
jgi:hypothetical protein